MNIKVPRTNVPLYWMYEQTGVLRQAVEAYLNYVTEPVNYPHPSEDQVALLIDYCQAWIEAPVWSRVDRLRQQAREVKTLPQLRAWLNTALEQGVDPL